MTHKAALAALTHCSMLLLVACGLAPAATTSEATAPTQRAMRIVSLDYCADQYLLKLADRERILALSPDAHLPFSYMRGAAEGLESVRPVEEDVLVLHPDLIIRSYGGGPNAAALYQRAGVPVLNIGWTGSIDGIRQVIGEVATGLGEPERGQALIADMDARLAALDQSPTGKRALYMTLGGVTSGPGSLVDDMLRTAGLSNFETRPGWRPLPLEKLARDQPDIVAAAFFESLGNAQDAWSAMRHPVARAQIDQRPGVALHGAWTACGGWFLLDAIEALARTAQGHGDDQR